MPTSGRRWPARATEANRLKLEAGTRWRNRYASAMANDQRRYGRSHHLGCLSLAHSYHSKPLRKWLLSGAMRTFTTAESVASDCRSGRGAVWHSRPRDQLSLLIPKVLRFDPFHGIKPATRAGAVRSAMRGIGQAPQRTRWPVSCHRRPGAFARRCRCAWLEVGRRRRQSRLACGQNHPGEMGQTSGPLVLLNARPGCRRSSHVPPLKALRATVALPACVIGPVDFSQGRHCWINSACRALLSAVQPLVIALLQ